LREVGGHELKPTGGISQARQMAKTYLPCHPGYFLRAIGDWSRLRILLLLLQRQMCIEDISFVIQMSRVHVSRQLAYLRKVKLLTARKVGLRNCYEVPPMTAALLKKATAGLMRCFENANELRDDAARALVLSKMGICCSSSAALNARPPRARCPRDLDS
jgi:DNA-binding transcriptional ArsR family regulator